MDALKIINNIPWKRFSTPYSMNASEVKLDFLKILEGNATGSYKSVENNVEHQDTLWRLSPWALKVYIALLIEENPDKAKVLEGIRIIYEAANFNIQGNEYKPTKGMIEKYSQIKPHLFDDENTDEFWLLYKKLHNSYIHVIVMEYINHYKSLIESFIVSENAETAQTAETLLNSIENPRKYI